MVWSAKYESFGKATVETGTVENNLRFPGQYYDQETGLYYNYHRYYDPGTGRYLRVDPIGFEGGINFFSYVQNNPLKYIDSMGLACGSGWTDYIVSDKLEGFDFTSCCEKHDKCYEGKDGQCDKTQKQCDDDFYNCMKKKCDSKYLSYRKCYEQANTGLQLIY